MSWSCSVNPRLVGSTMSSDFLRTSDRFGTGRNTRSPILVNKYRLKWTVIVHVLFVLFMAFRLSIALYVMAGIRPPRFLQRLQLPPAQSWELVWLVGSFLSCAVGIPAITRNRSSLVRLYAIATVLGGLVPAVYAAAFDVRVDLMSYWHTHHTKLLFRGVPVIVLWSMFLTAAIQLHCYGLYFAICLLSAWRERAKAKKIAT